jgi:hypothetical protein
MATLETDNLVLIAKDPNDIRTYGYNFTDLLPTSVTLATASVVSIAPAGLLVGGAATGSATVSGGTASASFTAGTAGVRYRVTFRGVFSDGQQVDRTVTIPVEQR